MQEAQRLAALTVRRVLDGATLPAALSAVAPPEREAAGRRRALVQELAFGTLRYWGRLDALVRVLAAKPFSDPALSCLVAVAIYQLDETRAPPFAVVDHAVNAAAVIARPAAKGLVNALLRRYLRERESLNAAVRCDPVARWSYPAWWIRRVERDFPDAWEAILDAGNARPPLALRVNPRVGTRDALLAAYVHAGIGAVAAGAAGILVATPQPVADLPGFDEGAFSVQDLGAQLAAPLLRIEAGQRVLDACAAPGGKTSHIAELADVDLLALDSDETRLLRVRQNLDRLRLASGRVRVEAGDAGEPSRWWDGIPFDRILADVPCTASGVVRRHPDAKWLRRETDIGQFVAQQARLLDALWTCLARGGLLLYVTCSLFEAENEAQIAAFAARHSEALRESLTFAPELAHQGGQLLPSPPGASHNQDGFFYALIRKP
ncbi:MAG: 16S rRNA (cytosine(967)-C(5))-methyltransferase RsmB [Betaproteobacteria bacterium]